MLATIICGNSNHNSKLLYKSYSVPGYYSNHFMFINQINLYQKKKENKQTKLTWYILFVSLSHKDEGVMTRI